MIGKRMCQGDLVGARKMLENLMIQVLFLILAMGIIRGYQDYMVLKKEGRL
jgi:hypothetical protein